MGSDRRVIHQAFLDRATAWMQGDDRLLGLGVMGSWNTGDFDAFSDLDLIFSVRDECLDEVLSDRPRIAAALGPFLAGFTGEHVGGPRVFICLYGPPALHVDLKFVRSSDFHPRVEDPVVAWQREGALTEALAHGEARWPPLDHQGAATTRAGCGGSSCTLRT